MGEALIAERRRWLHAAGGQLPAKKFTTLVMMMGCWRKLLLSDAAQCVFFTHLGPLLPALHHLAHVGGQVGTSQRRQQLRLPR